MPAGRSGTNAITARTAVRGGTFLVSRYLIEVKGFAVVPPPPPPRVTGFDLDSDNDRSSGVWGNDETIWVGNDDGGTGNKIFAYKRSDGSRDSAKDFDSLDGAGNDDVHGICSDGTTMFVADRVDDKVYAYQMSDRTRDSTKDITLAALNDDASGVWCDGATVWVGNDEFSASAKDKIFAYKRSDGTHDSDKDMESLYVSTADAGDNATEPQGLWSDGTTMFVVDSGDDKVFAFKLSDESQDSAKNIELGSAITSPLGLWFDGRVLWVATPGRLYVYDLPGAQPDNTPAVGVPEVRTHTTEDIWTATLTVQTTLSQTGYGVAGYLTNSAFGSLSPGTTFTLDTVTYTVRVLVDTKPAANSGALFLQVDSALPREFTISVDGTSFSSADAAQSAVTDGYEYLWSGANLSWSASATISVVLSVESVPAEGVEVMADVSGITDANGLDDVFFHYQWIRVDGTTVTELDGETSSTYTPVAADVGKDLKVRVVFDDDDDNKEYPRTSDAVGPVAPAVTVSFGQAVYAVAEAATTTVKVKLSADPKRKVVVPLVVTNQGGASNSDYSGVPTSVTFASGDTEQSFTFSATDDTVDDDDDSVGLAFGELPAGVTEGATGSATVFIVDDDDPEVTVGFEFATYSVDEGDSDTVKVVLSEDPKREVVVPLTVTNLDGASNSDYSGVPSQRDVRQRRHGAVVHVQRHR